MTDVEYDSGGQGQIKEILHRASNPGGSIPDGLPLPLTLDVFTEALKDEAATLMRDVEMEECALTGDLMHRFHCPRCGVRAWL